MAAVESVDSAAVAPHGKLLTGIAGLLVLAVVSVASRGLGAAGRRRGLFASRGARRARS